MGFLDFALGATLGMANSVNQRHNRAMQLNERGIRLAQSYRYEAALECFLEAERLAPSEPAIKQNIRLCYDALNMIDDYYCGEL